MNSIPEKWYTKKRDGKLFEMQLTRSQLTANIYSRIKETQLCLHILPWLTFSFQHRTCVSLCVFLTIPSTSDPICLLYTVLAIRLRYITDTFDVIKNWNAFYRWLRLRARNEYCKGKHFDYDPCIVYIHFLCTSEAIFCHWMYIVFDFNRAIFFLVFVSSLFSHS